MDICHSACLTSRNCALERQKPCLLSNCLADRRHVLLCFGLLSADTDLPRLLHLGFASLRASERRTAALQALSLALTSCVFDLWASIALDKGALVLASKSRRLIGVRVNRFSKAVFHSFCTGVAFSFWKTRASMVALPRRRDEEGRHH